MPARHYLFSDFHLHGAHETQWHQQYVQLSPGVMRSRLSAWAGPGVQVFNKWMSERVVQQGSLPGDQVCFSLPADAPAGASHMQGQALEADSLFMLRGGEEFEIQRPQGLALLSLSFPREAFLAALDALPRQSPAHRMATRTALRLPEASLQRLRLLLQRLLQTPAGDRLTGPTQAQLEQLLMGEVLAALALAQVNPVRASGRRAAAVVHACQGLVGASTGAPPPAIDDLCQRLGTSRRTLQNSFQQTAGLSPVQYLRGVRLNSVRQRLLATPAPVLTVSQAATDQGFDHLSHFAQAYKDLFGELPSRTARGPADTARTDRTQAPVTAASAATAAPSAGAAASGGQRGGELAPAGTAP